MATKSRERRGRSGAGRLAAWCVPVFLAGAGACAGPQGVEAPSPEAERAAVADTMASDTAGSTQPVEAARDTAVTTAGGDTGDEPGGPDAAERGETRTKDGEESVAEGATRDGAAESAGGTAGEAVPAPAELPVPILPGALLPRTRIVAFYGNPASKRMGILGELPPDEMLARLDAEVEAWRQADPRTPVQPALQVIAVMATGDPGRDSLFRLRMPDSRIRQVAEWASRRDGLLFLDIQPGRSTVAAELEPLEPWLARPDVHLALDPEWAMDADEVPGRRIGSMSADDINHAIGFLADIVERHNLPPKVLVVHRFTASMVRRAEEIRRDPRVQVVINMDGWGAPAQKRFAYHDIVAPEADQFTGFKLFFHNDVRDGSPLLTPGEILQLDPPPIYIQYQ